MEIDEEDIEKTGVEIEQNLQKGIDIARKHNINLTKFKQEISKHLTTKNDEDQWTWDYQSYLEGLARITIFQAPVEWGKEFYHERWQ